MAGNDDVTIGEGAKTDTASFAQAKAAVAGLGSAFEKTFDAVDRSKSLDNAAKAGFNWGGNGRACEITRGWFAVDNITYSGTTITALDLRFEQHCEGMVPALRGVIHWR